MRDDRLARHEAAHKLNHSLETILSGEALQRRQVEHFDLAY